MSESWFPVDYLTVRFAWGDHDLPDIRMRGGDMKVIETDGPMNYPLMQLDLSANVLTIRPMCLMMSATPDSLRRYADILDKAPKR